ncbi:phosphotransferase [Candidatus Pacearchaeota archaeon]|nr:phosphotransferase [Candidatus Pacearchaeota archaeon]
MKLTNLKKKDFEDILGNYNIGKYKKSRHIKWALGNTVYIVDTTRGKYVIKIFERAKLDYIKYQIKIMNFLNLKKVPIPKLIKTKKNRFLLIRNDKRMLIQRFVEGKTPKKLSKKLVKDIAKKMGLMNKYLLKLKLQGKYIWQKDHEFKPFKFKGVKTKGFDFKEEEKKLLTELRKLKRKKLRKSVVHGDFRESNLIVKNDELNAIIDWNDSHEDYLPYEIAVLINDSFISKNKVQKKDIKLFFKEYQKYLKLNGEEKKGIYYFIKQRYLGIIFYHIKQMKTHQDLVEDLKKSQGSQINQYKTFNKLSLEKFLELFEK